MENTPTTTAANEGLVKAARVSRSLLKGVSGVFAIGMSALLLSSGMALPPLVLLGGLTLYTGGRQLFEAGKELLPLKIQSAVSTLFTGKPLTELAPVKGPQTPLGKVFRVVEYVNLAVLGALSFFVGGFALGMGSQESGMGAMMLGGMGLAATGLVNVAAEAVKGVRSLLRRAQKNTATAPEVTKPVVAPEAAPAPVQAAKPSTPAFNNSATPASTPDSTPAVEAPKPAAPQPPTV